MKNKLLLLLVSLLAALLLAELSLRLFRSNPYADSGTDEILKLRVHHAHINQQFNRELIDEEHPTISYRTNDRGYLEPAARFDNPDWTVVFLGGSTTECIAVNEQQRFPFLVSRLLEKNGLKVNSLNAARSGGTVHDSINILLNHAILEEPDVVILMHATNDIGVLKVDSNYSTRMGRRVSITDIGRYAVQLFSSRSASVGFLREVLTRNEFQQRDEISYSDLQIEDLEPYRARLEIFIAICRAFGTIPVLMTQPVAGTSGTELTPYWLDLNAQARFNQVIREISEGTQTDLIDLDAHIADAIKSGEAPSQIFYDGLHVSDYGSSLYARYIAERIQQILNSQHTE